ncbi:hypothetical protein K3495_g5328 [Podosphaera aphanis]|nr:hypothetical protein K3495_g5328 [Podosphaera aphanis]
MESQAPTTRATVLISGEGSNLQALIDASATSLPYLKIVRVISNKSKANGLNRARAAGIPTAYHNLISGKYIAVGEQDPLIKEAARERYDIALSELVLADKPDIVICAGFMHILSTAFLEPLEKINVPIINLHPALYGKYDGVSAIKRAYDDFRQGKLEDNKTGIMIHYVISEVDRGDPIIQREVECRSTETYDEFEERMHEHEHQLIVYGTARAIMELWRKRCDP